MVAPWRRLPTRRPPSLRWSASAAAEPAWARRRCPSSSGCAVHGAACGVAQVHTVRCVPARARGLGTACARGGGVAFFRAAIEGQPLFRSFVISTCGGSFSIHRSVKLAPENSSLRTGANTGQVQQRMAVGRPSLSSECCCRKLCSSYNITHCRPH